jgi:hypothetical protein
VLAGGGQEPVQPGRGSNPRSFWCPRQPDGNESEGSQLHHMWQRAAGLCRPFWVSSTVLRTQFRIQRFSLMPRIRNRILTLNCLYYLGSRIWIRVHISCTGKCGSMDPAKLQGLGSATQALSCKLFKISILSNIFTFCHGINSRRPCFLFFSTYEIQV